VIIFETSNGEKTGILNKEIKHTLEIVECENCCGSGEAEYILYRYRDGDIIPEIRECEDCGGDGVQEIFY